MTNSYDHQESDFKNISRIILESKHLIALSGAGISVDSGIPPFRGPGGLWTKLGEPAPDGYQQILDDPISYWENLINPDVDAVKGGFSKKLDEAFPNPAHNALAEMEHSGLLKYIITQNVDNLHYAAGSINVAEIHGNRNMLRCINCNYRWPKDGFDLSIIPPMCQKCGGLIKGDTVSFGEPIPQDVLQLCYSEAVQCDVMIVIGTSALVYPAAALPQMAARAGADLIEINTESTPLTEMCLHVLKDSASVILPALMKHMYSIS